jgi:hypothetical protein
MTILAIGLIQLAAFAGCAETTPPPAASPTGAPSTDDGGAPAPAPVHRGGGW